MDYTWSNEFDICDIKQLQSMEEMKTNLIHSAYKPCMQSYTTPTRRRALQNDIDGNSTMTISTADSSVYTILNSISLDVLSNDFETAFRDDFDINLNIIISVEQTNDDDGLNTNSGSFWDDLNILWYIIFVLIFMFCCIATILCWFCRKSKKVNRKILCHKRPQ